MRISDWSSDVCSSDLGEGDRPELHCGSGQQVDEPVQPDLLAPLAEPDEHRADPEEAVVAVPQRDEGTADDRRESGRDIARGLAEGDQVRSEERRVGEGCVSTCRSRWSRKT